MTASSISKPSFIAANRNAFIAASVLLFHALAVWGLQTGLLMRVVEIVVPVEVLAQIVELPAPQTAPPVPVSTPPLPAIQPTTKQAAAKPTPATQPVIQTAPPILTVNEPAPAADAFVAPAPQPPAPIAAPSVSVAAVASATSAPPAPAPAKVVLPSSDAQYLNNPKPPYPPMSKRLNEQGNVMVRIYIDADGLPEKAELQKTSGFERLDQAALAVVMKWRYVPGKRNGVPEAMWMGTTIKFILE